VRIGIHGRVQGVGFRYWMQEVSDELGLAGWVRNRSDGSVEAVISGQFARVAEMLARCREGPPAARVSDVAVLAEEDFAEEDATFSGFEIKPTG
jgi:acylphosphatase